IHAPTVARCDIDTGVVDSLNGLRCATSGREQIQQCVRAENSYSITSSARASSVGVAAGLVASLARPDMPAHPTARDATDWEFNFPPRDGVHYLVHPVIGRLGSQISATFVVERDGRLVESDPCEGSQAAVRLFFQRRGDDLTAAKEFHRWWSMEMFLL